LFHLADLPSAIRCPFAPWRFNRPLLSDRADFLHVLNGLAEKSSNACRPTGDISFGLAACSLESEAFMDQVWRLHFRWPAGLLPALSPANNRLNVPQK